MDCDYCEAGNCELCDGLTLEGFDCDCAEDNHCDSLTDEDDLEYASFTS